MSQTLQSTTLTALWP